MHERRERRLLHAWGLGLGQLRVHACVRRATALWPTRVPRALGACAFIISLPICYSCMCISTGYYVDSSSCVTCISYSNQYAQSICSKKPVAYSCTA